MHYTKWTWLFSIHIGCWQGFWKTSHTNQWLWARYSSSHQVPFKKIGANWWPIQESSASVAGKQVTKIYCSHCNHSLRTWCRCGCINCRRGLICCFSGSRKCIWGNWQKRKCRQRAGWKMCCQCNRAQKVNANEQKGGLQRSMKIMSMIVDGSSYANIALELGNDLTWSDINNRRTRYFYEINQHHQAPSAKRSPR